MKTRPLVRLFIRMFGVLLAVHPVLGQTAAPMPGAPFSATADSAQIAQILGLEPLLQQLAVLQAKRGCAGSVSLEELTVRQQLLESVQLDTLNVDGVLAEISNEQGELSDLRTTLQARRDSIVARLNTAALITGSAAGAAVSATQFTTLGSRANNIGDGFGIGSGIASTIFSIVATREQKGTQVSVGSIPNMLAPLFDSSPVLHTYYPPSVMEYLQTVPANESPSRGTRLEQLKAQWVNPGRLDTPHSGKHSSQVAALTSSSDPSVKVSINDLSNRIAMLVDVAGRVSLIKRDLATVMRSYMQGSEACRIH